MPACSTRDPFIGTYRFYNLHGEPTSRTARVTNAKVRMVGRQLIGWVRVDGEIMGVPALEEAISAGVLRYEAPVRPLAGALKPYLGRPAVDITGRVYGRLKVWSYFRGPDHNAWECHCQCGAIVFVDGRQLRRGTVRSCGCLSRELRSVLRASKSTKQGSGSGEREKE